MHRPPKPLSRPALAAACVLALALAACGDDAEPAASTPTTTSTSTAPPAETEVSKLRAEFNQQIETVLTTQYELTPEQTECAIERLNVAIDEAEVKRAVKTGEPSPEFLDAAFSAGEECGAE